MTGSYIATTTEDDIQWLMAAGQSLGLAVAQLRHHLGQTLGPAHGALLTEPVEDATGRATDWYGVGAGPATPLDQLPPGPRATMTNTVWALLRDIRAEGLRLGASADADERVLGAMLDKVSHVPDVSCVRVRGDAPLVIAWAHGRAGQSIDLSELYRPVDVPMSAPAAPGAPLPKAPWPSWVVTACIVAAVVVLAVGVLVWSERKSDETTATGGAPLPPQAVLITPPEPSRPNPSSQTTAPSVIVTTPPPTAPIPTLPAPTVTAQPAVPSSTASTSTTVARTTPLSPTPDRPEPISPAAPPATQAPTPPTATVDTATSLSTRVTPDPTPPVPDVKPTAPDAPTDGRRAEAFNRAAPEPVAPATPQPESSAAASQTAQLPPHESEAAPPPRPFTAGSIRAHDLGMLAGCWTLHGSFASADVQTGAAATVTRWRACFGRVEPGAAALTGTQSLGWADGRSCSGPVIARFLPDDTLEIADAADCLGDRTLFQMRESCTRKDDSAMQCAWTAHDHAGKADFNGNGLALTPTVVGDGR